MKKPGIEDPPRRQHYYFVHTYLCDRAWEHGKLLVNNLRTKTGTAYLQTLWVLRGLTSETAEDGFIDSEGLDCSPIKIGDDYYGAIVQFPNPVRMTEAYFAAIILPVGADISTPADYYTLEFTIHNDGSEGTVLGYWRGGMHASLIPTPEPNKEAFLSTITELILKRENRRSFRL